MHLVNWDVVKKPLSEGGLQIRDPTLVNLALGGNILWKQIHEPSHPVSVTLHSKHAPNNALTNLQNASAANSTQIWKLCCKRSKFFKKIVYRIPGNGKRTHLWLDSIMGSEPLAENDDIADIRNWLEHAGVSIISNISSWD